MSEPSTIPSKHSTPIGLLLMAYGGPDSLADIPGYLAEIGHGRATTSFVLDEIVHNYRRIGGRSPLLEHSQQQLNAVIAKLEETSGRDVFKGYLGMRHWAPWLEEVVGKMIDDGIERAVSMVLAPQYSQLSVDRYHAKIADGLAMYRGHIDFRNVKHFHNVPGLIQPLAARVLEGLRRSPENDPKNIHVILSAHSLPAYILDSGDPYDAQVRETANLVAVEAGLQADQWSFCYQSAGRTPIPWLGPHLDDTLPQLAEKGIRDVVCVPVGFVCDHAEILHDIDVQARSVAHAYGMRLERPPALNCDPIFVSQLAALVRQQALDAHWLLNIPVGTSCVGALQ